jgi:hypothetical protein
MSSGESSNSRTSAASPRPDQLTWSQLRPILVGALLSVDAGVVAVLAIARPAGWVPPLIAFGAILIGLVALLRWSLRHRGDG